MTTCCGQERASRFCPECGKALATTPLLDLIAYCRSKAKEQGTRAKILSAKERSTPYSDVRDSAIRLCASAQRSERKWTKWADAVSELLAKQGTQEGPQDAI